RRLELELQLYDIADSHGNSRLSQLTETLSGHRDFILAHRHKRHAEVPGVIGLDRALHTGIHVSSFYFGVVNNGAGLIDHASADCAGCRGRLTVTHSGEDLYDERGESQR